MAEQELELSLTLSVTAKIRDVDLLLSHAVARHQMLLPLDRADILPLMRTDPQTAFVFLFGEGTDWAKIPGAELTIVQK